MSAPSARLSRSGLAAIFIVAALALCACPRAHSQSGAGSAAAGILAGVISRGPMWPVAGPGVAPHPNQPVAGAELKFVDSRGAVAATVRSGADGRYRIAIPAGQYRIERGAGFNGVTKNLPALVSVSPRSETRFDVLVDTGIR